MLHENHLRYFFSIQPFWDMGRMENFIRSDHISVSEFRWIHDVMSCVPGNGQLGIMLSNPEDFSGYCFGVADCRDEIPLYGMTKGYFIRFSPGAFSAVFKIPSVEIPARGIELSLVLPQEKLERIKDAVASKCPGETLLRMCEGWGGGFCQSQKEQKLANEVVQLIWSNRGALRIKNLEQETLYSARRLQEVVTRQVGIGPKQLCRQTRFQNALKLITSPKAEVYTQAEAAQILGYSDQAHYNREFKEFSGVSPCQFQKIN